MRCLSDGGLGGVGGSVCCISTYKEVKFLGKSCSTAVVPDFFLKRSGGGEGSG